MSFSRRHWARSVLLATLLALAAGPAPASQGQVAGAGEAAQVGIDWDDWEAWEELGAKTLDVVALRPLGAMATVAGFGFFLASAPLAAASRQIGASWDVFVLAPADYTIARPLGDF